MKGVLKIKRSTVNGQQLDRKWKLKFIILEAGLITVYKNDTEQDIFDVKNITNIALIEPLVLSFQVAEEKIVQIVRHF